MKTNNSKFCKEKVGLPKSFLKTAVFMARFSLRSVYRFALFCVSGHLVILVINKLTD